MKYLILLLIVISCGDDKLKKVEELDGFRIIGITSTTPEVAPGTNGVALKVYVSDTKGGGRVIDGTVEACIDPGISFGASVGCSHDPTKVSGVYSINTASDLDLGAANLFTGLATDTFLANVPLFIFNGRSTREQNNGVAYIVIFRFNVDGRVHESFKRIIATTRAIKNVNPVINSVNLNGVAVVSTKPRKGEKFLLDANAPETYSYVEVDDTQVSRSEALKVAWFVSQGKFDKAKSDAGEEVEFTEDPPGDVMLLLSVLRDDRGGISIQRKILNN